jgi:hypothetical protein
MTIHLFSPGSKRVLYLDGAERHTKTKWHKFTFYTRDEELVDDLLLGASRLSTSYYWTLNERQRGMQRWLIMIAFYRKKDALAFRMQLPESKLPAHGPTRWVYGTHLHPERWMYDITGVQPDVLR